ncbi:MAG: methylated-DNA--[protein]-cysteine S-methyltransferase [Burkholderiaceae bacterium]|nr:methylated-DNA--[protein]-cysteine S-methyltransferase [Burkholderiaceae bacterium]
MPASLPAPPDAWTLFDTPVGVCGLAWDAAGRLAGSQLPEADAAATQSRMRLRFGMTMADPPVFVQQWMARLRAVMAGAGDRLADIALADEAAPAFHRRVWALARQIPPGHTRSYGELALALGGPAAARAVGQALGANPFAPFVPCHRVLAARGAAGGFSAPGGRHTKLRLLQLEGARFEWQADQPGLF